MTQEQIEMLKLLAESISGVTKETGVLADANKNLKDAKNQLLLAMRAGKTNLDAENKAIKDANAQYKEYTKAIKDACGEAEKEITLTKRITDAKKAYLKVSETDVVEKNKAREALIRLLQQEKNEENQLKKIKDELEKSKTGWKEFASSLEKVKSGFMATIAPAAQFISMMGAGSISIKGIVENGLKFNETMFNVSRAQMAAGKGSQILSSDINALSKTTNLSQLQFLEFANTIQKGFIGVRPSLQETAKLSKDLSVIVGPSFDAQKNAAENLINIQSQFPALYDKIRAGMDLVAKNAGTKMNPQDEARLKSLQSEIYLEQELTGVSSAEKMQTLQYTTQVTAAQMELNATQAKAQELSKEMSNAQTELFKQLQPLILGATNFAKSLVSVLSDWREPIVVAGVALTAFLGIAKGLAWVLAETGAEVFSWGALTTAIGGATAAMRTFLASNPIGWVLLGVTAIAGAWAAVASHNRHAKEEAEAYQAKIRAEAAISEQISKLSDDQKNKFNELYAKKSKDLKTDEDRRALQLQLLDGLQQEDEQNKNVLVAMEKKQKNVEIQLGIINKMAEGYRATAEAAAQFGMVNEGALQGIVDTSKRTLSELSGLTTGWLEALSKDLNQKNGIVIPVSFKMDAKGKLSDAAEFLQNEIARTQDVDKRTRLYTALTKIQHESVALTKAEAAVSQNILDKDMARVKQMEAKTSVYESRLNAERQLMEAAQFGMGASVSMMQKQVDLAHEILKTYKQTDEQMQHRLEHEKGVKREQIEQIKNAKTSEEAEKIINGIAGNDVLLKQDLNAYATQHQELTKKEMDQQMKIVELTKDIREGYLSAIREMSTGAGVFEAILGTQKTGVTQLMDAVDKASGEPGKLNTMALGGRQTKEQTEAGIGKDVTGRYNASGSPLSFIGSKEQEARNKRYYGYQENVDRMKAMGTGESSKVGSALGAGENGQFIRPAQEEYNINRDSTYEAIIKAKGVMGGDKIDYERLVNVSLRNGGGKWGTNERRSDVVNTSTALMSMTTPGQIANSSFARVSSSGDRMGDIYNLRDAYSKEMKGKKEETSQAKLIRSQIQEKSGSMSDEQTEANREAIEQKTKAEKIAELQKNIDRANKNVSKRQSEYDQARKPEEEKTRLEGFGGRLYESGLGAIGRGVSTVWDYFNKEKQGSDKSLSDIYYSKYTGNEVDEAWDGDNTGTEYGQEKFRKKEKQKEESGIALANAIEQKTRLEQEKAKLLESQNQPQEVLQEKQAVGAEEKQETPGERTWNAREIRQAFGKSKQGKDETKSQYQKRLKEEITLSALQGKPWEKFSAKERENFQAEAEKASKMEYKEEKGFDSYAQKNLVMETKKGVKDKRFTSAAQEKGEGQDMAAAAEFNSPQAQAARAQAFNTDAAGSGGGAISGVITVNLSSELTGTIQNMNGILIKLGQAASGK